MNPAGEYILVGGSSGTGKSTRTQAAFRYLQTLEEPEQVTTAAGKHFGHHFPQANLTFMGGFSDFNGEKRFIGGDGFNSVFSSVAQFHDFVVDYIKTTGRRLLIEGSSVLHTNRWFPQGIAAAGLPRGRWMICTFERFVDYEERLYGRTGKLPLESGAGWGHNKAYQRHIATIRQQLLESASTLDGTVEPCPHDAPLSAVGEFIGLRRPFVDWCSLPENDIPALRRKSVRTGGLLDD